uniref:Transmembrane protein 131 n=1 Tax=Cyclopterus lumpus TaxID=8103 RepID=A0A8C2WWH8_CYCLU
IAPILIPPHESRYIFSLLFRPVRPSIHIDSNILLITNASKFHLPVRAYTGFLEPLVLPPSLKENILDFGVCSATDTSSVTFVVVNSNPIELEIKSWLVTGDSLSMELLKTEKGNSSAALSRLRELQNSSASQQKTVILASGYYAAFRVTLVAAALEGAYDGAVHITTDYEILTIPVRALIAVGTLNSSPKHIVLPASFPGKVVHQSFSIQSSFTQKVRLQQIRSLTEDIRFYYKRLRNNKDELEPRRKSKVANIYFDASLQCGDQCYVGLPFVLKAESKPHGLTLQEDIWDADVDLHQKLLRRWKELKERSGHSVEAVFEVNTDLQKNVQARITAHLTWPSLVNSSRSILFPLTNTNGSSEEEVILQNPADVLVYVQVLPLALLPNPSVFSGKLADRFTGIRSSSGFVEGSTRPFVYNLLLLPGEVKAFSVRFTPTSNHSVSSLLIVRNNLTVIDTIVLHGRGTTESLKVAGKPPGHGSSLRFKMTEALLKDCMDLKEPNFTLKRTFRVENTGLLPITIRPAQINGQVCEGYGFKVLNCQDFDLKPNASKDLIILFTPDFTSSRVIRELKLVTCGGSEFVFVLNASLPYHMLASCAETLPRPSWELELYVIVSLIMSSMFLLVIATAYLEAQSIWEPFKRRVSVEANSSMETGRPFNLREIVQIHSDSKRCRTRAPSPYRTKVPASVLAAGDQTRVQASEPCASCPFSGLESKGKLRGKTKAQRKKEEKEKKPAVKTLGDELKDNMADNDDSSSTTTETSNPDTEPSIKEVRVHQEEPHQELLLGVIPVCPSLSEGNQKKAPGNKLCAAPPLPGKNGTPTFAAVAAGYDKSPGDSGLWSPIDSAGSPNFHCANSFSAFGPNSSFNLTKVFSGMNVPKSSEPQQSWPEFSSASSIWDTPSSDSLHTWPSSSGSPTAPTASLLGSGRNPWSASTPFGSSIWSTSADSALHPFPPPPGSIALTDLVGVPAPSPPPVAATTELSRTYNPWNMWRPTLSRRSSEPWPSSSDT